jgi:hypothetical protein
MKWPQLVFDFVTLAILRIIITQICACGFWCDQKIFSSKKLRAPEGALALV